MTSRPTFATFKDFNQSLNEPNEEKVYVLVGTCTVDAENTKIESRLMNYRNTLRKIDRKGAVGIDRDGNKMPDMFEFMFENPTDGIVRHTGNMIHLLPKQVKETKRVYVPKQGNFKTYTIK